MKGMTYGAAFAFLTYAVICVIMAFVARNDPLFSELFKTIAWVTTLIAAGCAIAVNLYSDEEKAKQVSPEKSHASQHPQCGCNHSV